MTDTIYGRCRCGELLTIGHVCFDKLLSPIAQPVDEDALRGIVCDAFRIATHDALQQQVIIEVTPRGVDLPCQVCNDIGGWFEIVDYDREAYVDCPGCTPEERARRNGQKDT